MSELIGALMGAEPELELRVASGTPVPDLASAISHAIYDGKRVTLRAIGPPAISQAMKAAAAARGFVAPRGIDLYVVPGFTDVSVRSRTGPGMEQVTGMLFRIIVS